MELIKDLGIRIVFGRGYRFGLFVCPSCKKRVEKIKKDGIPAKYCSHKCYAENREMRGGYRSYVMNRKYRMIYCPEHPHATGTRKLYVFEHRLVMERKLGRHLTKDEVVHHINENTLDNRISNLQLMTPSEHSKLHRKKTKRDNYGKYKSSN